MTIDALLTSGDPFVVIALKPYERQHGPAWALELRTVNGEEVRVIVAQSPNRDGLLRASLQEGLQLRVERFIAASGAPALRFKPADSREVATRKAIHLTAIPQED